MMEFIGVLKGLFVDFAILGGVILFIMSSFQRYRQYRVKFIVIGIVLVAIGFTFLDYESLQQAYEQGQKAAENI